MTSIITVILTCYAVWILKELKNAPNDPNEQHDVNKS